MSKAGLHREAGAYVDSHGSCLPMAHTASSTHLHHWHREEGAHLPAEGTEDRRLGIGRTWLLTHRKYSRGESLPVQASVSSSVEWS